MTEQTIDARGLDCPEPVVRTRKAMAETDAAALRVLVSTDVPAENIQRMATTMGWSVHTVSREDGIELSLTRPEAASVSAQPAAKPSPLSPPDKVVVFITSDLFGMGDEPLGRVLMRSFIKTLKELTPRPQGLIFANAGVRLTTHGSDLLDDLRALETDGADILSCGTCLDYYQLTDDLAVGRVTNMFEIASALVAADRVLKP